MPNTKLALFWMMDKSNAAPGVGWAARFASLLNDVDLAAVVTFQRNSFGNAVEPAEVPAARK